MDAAGCRMERLLSGFSPPHPPTPFPSAAACVFPPEAFSRSRSAKNTDGMTGQ